MTSRSLSDTGATADGGDDTVGNATSNVQSADRKQSTHDLTERHETRHASKLHDDKPQLGHSSFRSLLEGRMSNRQMQRPMSPLSSMQRSQDLSQLNSGNICDHATASSAAKPKKKGQNGLGEVENVPTHSRRATLTPENIALASQSSYRITQHQLLRPYAAPLPRSQTFSHLGGMLGTSQSPSTIIPRPRPISNETKPEKEQEGTYGRVPILSRAPDPRRSLHNSILFKRQSRESAGPQSFTKKNEVEQSKPLTGEVFPDRATGKKKASILNLTNSQSNSYMPAYPNPPHSKKTATKNLDAVHGEKVKSPQEKPHGPAENCSVLSGHQDDSVATPKIGILPVSHGIQRAPAPRDLASDLDPKKGQPSTERSPGEGHGPEIGSFVDAVETATGRHSSSLFDRSSPTSSHVSSNTYRFSFGREISGYALLSAASAAYGRRRTAGNACNHDDPVANTTHVASQGPSLRTANTTASRQRSRIPTPVFHGSSATANASGDLSPSFGLLRSRERQYRPAARLSFNHPSSSFMAPPARITEESMNSEYLPTSKSPNFEREQSEELLDVPMSQIEVTGDELLKVEWIEHPKPAYKEHSHPKPNDPLAPGAVDLERLPDSNPNIPTSREDRVVLPMSADWWLGRYTSIVNRLRTDSLHQMMTDTQQVNISESGVLVPFGSSKHPGNRGLLDDAARDAAACEELRATCASGEARQSLEGFLSRRNRVQRSYRFSSSSSSSLMQDQVDGNVSTTGLERIALSKRYGINPLRISELRARAEAQRAKARQLHKQHADSPGMLEEEQLTPRRERRLFFGLGRRSTGGSAKSDGAKGDEERDEGKGEVSRKVSMFGKFAKGMRKSSHKS